MSLKVVCKKSRGLSIIEILVSVLLINFGILGLTKLQLDSYKTQGNSILALNAAFYCDALAEKLQANSALAQSSDTAYILNSYTNTPTTVATDDFCITETCTASELAIYDMNTWLYKIKNYFPMGQAKVTKATISGSIQYTISIRWQYKSDIKEYELITEV